ncbi:hypothetical protein PMZ80_001066 [Knufia obscura]|uniref:Uncharacterized protein n=1 Tax=Knufia obscura TaxID=1635080 RepID=A0ABR0S264_9EURO|nr:hypothetical protein PMZ80_001066 [Knufia obscura]
MASQEPATSEQSSPRYIYKIAPASPAPDLSEVKGGQSSPVLPPSDLDMSSNFIHMSTASQVPGTLERFFPVSTDKRSVIYLLRVELEPLEKQDGVVKWESPDATVCGPRPGEGLFPHLYFDEDQTQDEESEEVVSGGGLDSRKVKSRKEERRLWLEKR